jgi:hypothetical protein
MDQSNRINPNSPILDQSPRANYRISRHLSNIEALSNFAALADEVIE